MLKINICKLTKIYLFFRLNLILENIILSLNEKYLEIDNSDIVLQNGDELAIIPPISGGWHFKKKTKFKSSHFTTAMSACSNLVSNDLMGKKLSII